MYIKIKSNILIKIIFKHILYTRRGKDFLPRNPFRTLPEYHHFVLTEKEAHLLGRKTIYYIILYLVAYQGEQLTVLVIRIISMEMSKEIGELRKKL